jgi:hypothetical protein
MIQFEEREFGDAELGPLREEMAEVSAVKRRFDRFILVSLVPIVAVGVPLALGQARKDAALGVLAFGMVAVCALSMGYAYVREIGAHRRLLRVLEEAMDDQGRVKVTHCRTERMITMEEVEDEGPEYFFEVDPGRVYYVGGQHFDVGPDFPSTDFEVVEGFDGRGRPVHFEVRCHGRRLEPLWTIPRDVKLRMLAGGCYPVDGDLLDCALEDVERVILEGGRS